ncbi:MAG: hypothetical protein LC770_04695, partial [Acidobacteria bacterium]|nr:hypothetical protein [Acidobacteriota bacterium]
MATADRDLVRAQCFVEGVPLVDAAARSRAPNLLAANLGLTPQALCFRHASRALNPYHRFRIISLSQKPGQSIRIDIAARDNYTH